MKLLIKNMVCERCKTAVLGALEKENLKVLNIQLGEVEIKEELLPGELKTLDDSLKALGFEIIDDRKSQLIE